MLEGRSAVVTGGASGIGRAIAIELAHLGAKIVIADIRREPREGGQPTDITIGAAGGAAIMLQADISQEPDADRVIATAVEHFGRLDIVVNNAAVSLGESLAQTSQGHWDETIAVNLTGAFLVCRAAVRQMLQQPAVGEVRGRIVNIGSQHGMIAAPEDFAYGVSKAGLIYMTKQIAADYAAENIVCNTVSPGKIDTGKGGSAMEPRWIEYSRARTPMPRLGRPQDVARAVAFLASDQSSFTTGANLLVDGGWMAA